jgi:hypothetical protein
MNTAPILLGTYLSGGMRGKQPAPIHLKRGHFVPDPDSKCGLSVFVPEDQSTPSAPPRWEPTLNVDVLVRIMDSPRTSVDVAVRVEHDILVGYMPDGAAVARARPLAPEKGQPDNRVCAGCGGSMVGKRRQAKFCEDCLPTVQNTMTTRRRRAGKRRTSEKLAKDLIKRVKKLNKAGRKHTAKKYKPLILEQVEDALETFGPHRTRAILDVVARDVDRVQPGDAAHREHRVKFSVSDTDAQYAETDTWTLATTGVYDDAGTGGHPDARPLFESDTAKLMAQRDRLPPGRTAHWQQGDLSAGESVRWQHGLVKVPKHPEFDARSLQTKKKESA